MEISNYAVIISSAVVMTGWLVNNILNRRHEIAKRRLDYRLETLHSFIPVFKSIDTIAKTSKIPEDFYDKLNESHLKFQLYGNQQENEFFTKLMKAIEENNIKEVNNSTQKLMNLILHEIRNELKISEIQ